MRADYDAKIAELMADLEGTRGEKEKTDTDLAILKVRSPQRPVDGTSVWFFPSNRLYPSTSRTSQWKKL